MRSDELRQKYLEFFVSQGHSLQPSDVLVPTWDPSVLFTPAGMNQFKDHFLGKVKLDFTRATTCQKCLRTGDIDNVGRTAYHHTFFEMLGNFSFGDYFKREAIAWAWRFLTDPKWLGIDPERLSVTVYKDDLEAAEIWREGIGLPSHRIQPMDEDENFWPASAPSLGPDGVCGPCSEIYYRLDDGSSVEIWNLVFTQFNRVGQPPSNLQPLPSKNIDTGMGLERTASVLQGVSTNFHIDSLFPIVQAAAEVCQVAYEPSSDAGRRLRRITDHVRACVMAVHENVYPGPKKARYVIKRLLRRAVLDGHQLGRREPFLHHLVPVVAEQMGKPYPELHQTIQRVSGVIEREEADFFRTLDAGLERIERVFGDMLGSGSVMVDGGEAAQLYQTYGVPPELFQGLAAERNLSFDWDGYRQAMSEHEETSGGGQRELFQTGPLETLKESLLRTEFVGYQRDQAAAVVKGIVLGRGAGDRLVSRLQAGGDPNQLVRVVLDATPFYPEAGGQVGDTGRLVAGDNVFEVTDTQKVGELILHSGRVLQGELLQGAAVEAVVDADRRQAISRAHTATHLLHHALQQQLGEHAQQQGSKVDADWLRFDFSHPDALTQQQLADLESQVTADVGRAEPVQWRLVPLAEARQIGATMLFGEKYPDPVRLVSIGQFSKELCAGTHLQQTGQVDDFQLVAEESVASGVRRVVALTGRQAALFREQIQTLAGKVTARLGVPAGQILASADELVQAVRRLKKLLAGAGGDLPEPWQPAGSTSPAAVFDFGLSRDQLRQTARLLNVTLEQIPERLEQLIGEHADLRRELEQLLSTGSVSADQLLEQAEAAGPGLLLVLHIPGANPNMMRQWIDQLRKKSQQPMAILLASDSNGKVLLVAGLSRVWVDVGLSAGAWLAAVAPLVGGGGGGRPDLAQAGGKHPEKLPEALSRAKEWLRTQLAAIS
jgi:alanyl-tRNA synthetase